VSATEMLAYLKRHNGTFVLAVVRAVADHDDPDGWPHPNQTALGMAAGARSETRARDGVRRALNLSLLRYTEDGLILTDLGRAVADAMSGEDTPCTICGAPVETGMHVNDSRRWDGWKCQRHQHEWCCLQEGGMAPGEAERWMRAKRAAALGEPMGPLPDAEAARILYAMSPLQRKTAQLSDNELRGAAKEGADR
jgi:hypothetical protein